MTLGQENFEMEDTEGASGDTVDRKIPTVPRGTKGEKEWCNAT